MSSCHKSAGNATRSAAGVLCLLLCWAWGLGSARADSANFRRVDAIYIPEAWSEPEVSVDSSTGKTSYVPSIPTERESRDVGAVLDIGSATVHVNTSVPRLGLGSKKLYRLRFPSGRVVPMKLGLWARVDKRAWRLMKDEAGFYLELLSPRRKWRFHRSPD